MITTGNFSCSCLTQDDFVPWRTGVGFICLACLCRAHWRVLSKVSSWARGHRHQHHHPLTIPFPSLRWLKSGYMAVPNPTSCRSIRILLCMDPQARSTLWATAMADILPIRLSQHPKHLGSGIFSSSHRHDLREVPGWLLSMRLFTCLRSNDERQRRKDQRHPAFIVHSQVLPGVDWLMKGKLVSLSTVWLASNMCALHLQRIAAKLRDFFLHISCILPGYSN